MWTPEEDDDDVLAKLGEDGDTDNYFGGEGKPDGEGHGHVTVTEDGEVVYAREAAQHMPDATYEERISVNK